MGYNQTTFSKVTACLALTTAAAGFMWFFAAFLSAEEPVLTLDLPVIWTITLIIFAANSLILKKERPVFVPAAVDAVLAAVLYGLVNGAFYGDSIKICFVMCLCILLGTLMQVYWEIRGFSDESLLHTSQILLASAILQLIAAEYMDMEASWAVWTGGFAAVSLFGALAVKHSGTEKMENPGSAGFRTISVAGSALILAVTGSAALLAAGPLSMAVGNVLGWAVSAVKAVFGAVYSILAWLSEKIKTDMSGDYETESIFSSNEEWEVPEEGKLTPELAEVFFVVILLALAAVMLYALWQILSRKGSGRRPAKKIRAVKTKKEGSLLKQMADLWAEIILSVRTRITLARYPHSVAALLAKLEKAVYLNPETRRRQGETPREFITRLAVRTENQEFAAVLMDFADEIDEAFYGRRKNIFKDFTQHKKLLKTLKNSLTKRA